MSAVVGVADGKRVVLAADRRVAFCPLTGGGPTRRAPGVRKVVATYAWTAGSGASVPVLLGAAGRLGACAVVAHELGGWLRDTSRRNGSRMPDDVSDLDGLEAWVWRLGVHVDGLFVEHGFTDRDGDVQGELLVGVRGALFETGGHSVLRMERGYASLGSGSGYALGAVHVARGLPGCDDLEAVARLGVDAAAEHDPSVGDGCDVVTADAR